MEGCKVKFRNLSPNEPINAYHPNLYEVLKIPKRHVIQFTRGLYQVVLLLRSLYLLRMLSTSFVIFLS